MMFLEPSILKATSALIDRLERFLLKRMPSKSSLKRLIKRNRLVIEALDINKTILKEILEVFTLRQ